MSFTHLTKDVNLIKHLLHLQNLKNTFLLEVAQIQILLKFEYPIV